MTCSKITLEIYVITRKIHLIICETYQYHFFAEKWRGTGGREPGRKRTGGGREAGEGGTGCGESCEGRRRMKDIKFFNAFLVCF